MASQWCGLISYFLDFLNKYAFYKGYAPAVSFEVVFVVDGASVLFQRSQPADGRPFWLAPPTAFWTTPLIYWSFFLPSLLLLSSPLHQNDRHTDLSSKLDCQPMSPRLSEGTWNLSAKFTVTLSLTSSGSNMWKRTAVNMGLMGCPTSRFWRWVLSESQGFTGGCDWGSSLGLVKVFGLLLDLREVGSFWIGQ